MLGAETKSKISFETPDGPTERIEVVIVEPCGLKIHYTVGARLSQNTISRSLKISSELQIAASGAVLFKIFDRAVQCK
jgi:hypothetical protein